MYNIFKTDYQPFLYKSYSLHESYFGKQLGTTAIDICLNRLIYLHSDYSTNVIVDTELLKTYDNLVLELIKDSDYKSIIFNDYKDIDDIVPDCKYTSNNKIDIYECIMILNGFISAIFGFKACSFHIDYTKTGNAYTNMKPNIYDNKINIPVISQSISKNAIMIDYDRTQSGKIEDMLYRKNIIFYNLIVTKDNIRFKDTVNKIFSVTMHYNLFIDGYSYDELTALLLHEVFHNFICIMPYRTFSNKRIQEKFADIGPTLFGYGPQLCSTLLKLTSNDLKSVIDITINKLLKTLNKNLGDVQDIPALNNYILNKVKPEFVKKQKEYIENRKDEHPILYNRMMGCLMLLVLEQADYNHNFEKLNQINEDIKKLSYMSQAFIQYTLKQDLYLGTALAIEYNDMRNFQYEIEQEENAKAKYLPRYFKLLIDYLVDNHDR